MTGKPVLAFVVVAATACTPVRVAPGVSRDREELAIYTVVIDSVLETIATNRATSSCGASSR